MPGTPQARTPAKGTSGPHPVRRRAAARTVKSPGASPTSHHRAGPSTPPSGAKGKHASVSGGGGGLGAALHHGSAVTQSASAFPSSSPPPSRQGGTEGATTPLNPSLLAGNEAMSFPAAAGAGDAERRSDPPSPTVRSVVDTATELENGSMLSSPTAAARAMSLSSASLLSSTRALEGDVCDAAESRDAVRGAPDEEDIAVVIAEGAASRQASRGVQSDTTSAALPVTPERPVQVRFFRCAKPLLMTTQELQQQVVVGNEREEEEEKRPRVALGPRDAVVMEKASFSATLPLPTENENGRGEPQEEAEGEPTALEPRVPDMNTTLLGDDEEGEAEQAMDRVESNVVPCAPHQHEPFSTTATTAGEPTAEPGEGAAGPEMVSADVPPRRRTPVLTSNELHAALPRKNGTHSSLPQRAVRARLATDPDDDLEAELMCDMSVPTTPTSSNSSFADSRASSNGCVSDRSDNAVLQRVNTAAPASLPRRSAGPSGDELHNSEVLLHPPMREVPSPSPSHTDAAGAAVMEKHISLSSARGQSGSCGCTEGMTSPASHRTRRSTPRMEEEGTEEDRRSASPIVVAPPHMGGDDDAEACGIDSPSPADPADVFVENADAGSLAVVPLTEVRIRLNRKAQKLQAEKIEEEELGRASQSAVYHARFVPSAHDARHRIWKAALVSLETLIVEYEESLLTCAMQANAAAWLPSQPVTGLHHVNKAAMYPALPPAAKKKPAATLPPPSATHDPFLTALAQKGEGDSEMQLLFQLFAAAPSDASRAHLCSTFFAQQLSRYHNWVRHLQFEFLYVRIVAVRAMCMLEMHERRLTCMRRDLGVRDKIELFMLLAPRPRAPTLTSGRGVFSAFRMALHALGGGDGQQQSRAGSSSSNSKARGASTSRKPPPPATQARRTTPAQAAAIAAPSLGAPPRSSAARPDGTALQTFKPLFASERCRSGKYAVPVVSELAVSPGNLHSRGVSPATADRTASAATEEGEKDVAQPAMREVLWTADPPRDAASHHRGVPRPLNKTYSDYYKKVAERKGESTPVFGELHLPRLLRTNSRASSTSRRNSASERCEASQPTTRDTNGEEPPTEKRQTRRSGAAKEDELEVALQRFGQRFSSSTRHSRTPKRRRDLELSGGRLRAKERVAAKPRKRTPPPPPTEADFVDLRDDAALRRFL